jgi:hypothetical protein
MIAVKSCSLSPSMTKNYQLWTFERAFDERKESPQLPRETPSIITTKLGTAIRSTGPVGICPTHNGVDTSRA